MIEGKTRVATQPQDDNGVANPSAELSEGTKLRRETSGGYEETGTIVVRSYDEDYNAEAVTIDRILNR